MTTQQAMPLVDLLFQSRNLKKLAAKHLKSAVRKSASFRPKEK
jgi:hypothetical protein